MDAGRKALLEEALVHWPEVFGLAFALTRDRGRAEELSQEAFLRLGTMARDVDRGRPLRMLLLTIARNLSVSELRRRPHESLDQLAELAGERSDPVPGDPLGELLRQETRHAVRAALERMNPTWSAMLYLRDGLSCSYRQIAEILDKSEDVVRVTLHRARQRVRGLLESHVLEGGPP